MEFFIYSRKSVYTGKGESVENQVEMCRQYISAKFPDVSGHKLTVYEDEGFSGKNTERPQFQRMLRDMKLNKPDFIVCYRLDRVSRNVSDFSSLIEELNERCISFVCIKEEFDTSKPMGKAMMYIASVFAQLERETIAERVRDNMLMLARTGRWLGGTAPMGYTSERTQEIIMDGKMKTSCRLKDNPEELRAVGLIFEKFFELRSVSGVSKFLIRQNIKSRSGKFYSLLGIKEILLNPVYCIADRDALDYFTGQNADVCFSESDCSDTLGLLAYNKRTYKKKHAPRQPLDKWIIAIGKHKGRVTGKRWVAIRNILADNNPAGQEKMHNGCSLLSGLIHCEACGNRMFAKRRSCREKPEVFDYICNSKLRGGIALCACPNINGPQADALVCERLMHYSGKSASIYPALEKLKRDLRNQPGENPLLTIQAGIKKRCDEMDNLVAALSESNLGTAFVQRVNARIAALDGELSALSRERGRLEGELYPGFGPDTQLDMLAQALSSLQNSFGDLPVYEKRAFIKLLVKKIVWDGRDLHVYLDGA